MDVFERLEGGGTPRTAWEIAYASVTAVGRDALRNQDDLSALGFSVIELADAVAEAIIRREGLEDAHVMLSDAAVSRIHIRDKLSTLELRKTAGGLRMAEIERRAKTLINASMPHIDAAEAVRAVNGKVRRDKSRGITKTLDELAGEVAALALAAVDRELGAGGEPQPETAGNTAEAGIGAAATTAFYQAVAGAVEIDSLVGIVAGVKDGLRPLEEAVCQHEDLRSQLAAPGLLGHKDALRITADVSSRRHYPFGLRDQESHAYLVAAFHLLGARAGRKNVAKASAAVGSSNESGESAARKLLLDVIAADANQRRERKLPSHEYQPTPNRFDILRTLTHAHRIASDNDIQTILGATGNGNAAAAGDLLVQVFPLREENAPPWSSASWRSAGESVQGMLNFEHKLLSTLPAFSARDFENTAARVILLGLKNFINILLRAEGERAGYPNNRTIYKHRSAVILSNTLTTRVIGRDYARIFKELRLSVERGSRPGSGTTQGNSQPVTPTGGLLPETNDGDIPDSLVFLARPELLSLLTEVASLIAPDAGLSPAARRLVIPDPTKGPDPAEAARTRAAATACIQFVHWSQDAGEPDLTLERAFAEFYREMSDLGQPGFDPRDVAEILNDALALLPDFSENGTA